MSAAAYATPRSSISVLTDGPAPQPKQSRHDVDMILRRKATLVEQRNNWDTHWQLVADIVWPDWADFTMHRMQGERRTQKQFDSTASYALERFSAVLEAFLTPRSQKFHGFRASNEDLNDEPGVKEWFDDAARILHEMRAAPESNYYGAVQVCYKSHGAFGNAACNIEPNRNGGIAYTPRHIKGLYIAHDDQGVIDTVYECYSLSVRAAAIRFGEENLPPQLKEKLEKDPFSLMELTRCCFPRKEYDPGRSDQGGMPYVSLDIHEQTKHVLSEGGHFERPTVYSRYTLNPTEDYGRGPAMVALADILTLQEMEKTHLRAGELVGHPPLLTTHDGVIGVGGTEIDLRGGAITYGGLDAQGNALVKPLITGGRLDITEMMMDRKRQNVRSAMLLDLFEILSENPQMTATQALLVAQERGMVTAPIVGRLQQEMLGPMIEREFGLAFRMGKLPLMPPALLEAQGEYRIEYTSPATRAQRAEEVVGITRTIEVMAPFINQDPSLLEVFDAEAAMRETAELTGVPSKLIRNKKALAKIREAQAEAAQQQSALEAAPPLAKAAKDATAAAEQMRGMMQ